MNCEQNLSLKPISWKCVIPVVCVKTGKVLYETLLDFFYSETVLTF